MAVTFRILPDRGLVYVRYVDFALIDESIQAFSAYMNHPDCRPGQKHLIDLAAVVGFERDYPRLMALQAFMARLYVGTDIQTMAAFFAPSREAQEMTTPVLRSWEGHDQVVVRVLDNEAEALAFLGLTETRIADLLANA